MRAIPPFGALREEAAGHARSAGELQDPEQLRRRPAVGKRVPVGGEYVGADPALRAELRWHGEPLVLHPALPQPVPQRRDAVGELGHRDVLVRRHRLAHPLEEHGSEDGVLACPAPTPSNPARSFFLA